MKMTKRILATATAALTVTAALAGCTGGTSSTTSTAAPSQADANKVYNIGICQLVQHEALDAATKGFKDTLTEKLGADKVKFDEQNAQGDSATCATICNQFVSSNYDLILGNGTAALQAAYTATPSIPILGTSITDYGTALDMAEWTGVSGMNVSGTSRLICSRNFSLTLKQSVFSIAQQRLTQNIRAIQSHLSLRVRATL